MYNFTRFPGGLVVNAAISGIEHALWDIAGKAAGLPVYMLLGGKCRDKIRCYQAANSPEQARSLIAKYGCTALKATLANASAVPESAGIRAFGDRAEAMRKAVGPNVDLCFDAHGRIWPPYLAYELAEVLKPVRPLFLEEAIRPENMDAMAKLRRRVQIPIATGEELYTKYRFQQLMSLGGADIVQPDICLAGGMLEQQEIAAIAEAHYVHRFESRVAGRAAEHFEKSAADAAIRQRSGALALLQERERLRYGAGILLGGARDLAHSVDQRLRVEAAQRIVRETGRALGIAGPGNRRELIDL
jgi:L-alanine-DL-glutamate epimerase-like enolase superfamily enzyme